MSARCRAFTSAGCRRKTFCSVSESSGHRESEKPSVSRNRATSSGAGSSGRRGSSPSSTEFGREAARFRGSWLDASGRNRSSTVKGKRMTSKALIALHGEEEYQFYVSFHCERHLILGRKISQWQRDFKTLRGREPNYEDMPERIRRMEETYLHIGFKLSNLD